MSFATKYAEAASTHVSHFFAPRECLTPCFCKAWATVIHLSHGGNGPGIKLKELAHSAQKPESALSGVRLLWTRFSNRSTDRRARRAVECVLPSLYLVTRSMC